MLAAACALLLQVRAIDPRAGTAELAGAWRFRTGDSAVFALSSYDDRAWQSLAVPGPWPMAGSEPYRGVGWYRLHVVISGTASEPLGLWLRSVAAAFEVFVDGVRIGGLGGFPPSYRPRTVIPLVAALPPPLQLPGPHVIAVRAYSEEKVGGITGQVMIGPVQDLERAAFRPDLPLLSAAVLLIGIGLMQVFFWMRRPYAHEHAAIFGVCLSTALFFVWWMPSVRVALEPVTFWLRLYLASAAAAAASYCYAFRKIFALERSDRWITVLALAFLAQVPVFLTVPGWSTLATLASVLLNPTLLVAALVTLGLAILQLREGTRHARTLLWGTLLLTVTLIHDIFTNWGVIAVRPAFPWLTVLGSVGFVASLSLTTAEKFVETETAALYDRLTGLYRREVVLDALSREIRRASRVKQPLAVIMLDVDRFKQLNDSLGHQGGDKVLAEIGRRMVDAGRAVDWLGRYGGEEFIAVLAATNTEGAKLAAERLRAAVSALPIATGRTARTVTLSAGVVAYEGSGDWPTTEQLIGAADAALYQAKHNGRNRVEVS